MSHLETSFKIHAERGLDFPICPNPACSHYGDCTPTSGPHTGRCLVCNTPHVQVSSAVEACIEKSVIDCDMSVVDLILGHISVRDYNEHVWNYRNRTV
jgi:hypothetical protein